MRRMADILTVGKLLELLKDEPPDLPIYSEGCDCIDLAGGVDLYENGIMIERKDSIEYRERKAAEPPPKPRVPFPDEPD
jgi:hypothetical protein